MKQIIWISAIAVTLFALTLDAVAQPQGGQRQGQRQQGQQTQGQPGQFGQGQQFGGLLRNEEVVKMLELSAEQTTALNEALRPQRGQEQRGQGMGGQSGAGQDGQRAVTTPAERRARTDAQWESVGKVLKAEQLKKFKELYFQANVPVQRPNAPADAPAPTMRLDTYLLGAVDLTDAQKASINKILDDSAAATQSAARLGRDATQEERTAFQAAARERQAKVNADITAVLTETQKKKVEELKAGAADIRTKLGLGQRAQQGAQQGGQRGQRQGGGADSGTYVPGSNSWQPGQTTPNQGTGSRRGGNFPRGGGN